MQSKSLTITEQEYAEETIKSLSKNLGFNSRNSVQHSLEFLFNHPEYWKHRILNGVSAKSFNSFREFAMYRTPWGLGWTDKTLEAFLLPELKEVWQEMEKEIPQAKVNHRPKKEETVIYNTYENNRGTSRNHSIAVLKRDAPIIAERVIAGEISAAEGMRQAGKKKPVITIPITVEGFAKAIMNRLNDEQREQLIDLITAI